MTIGGKKSALLAALAITTLVVSGCSGGATGDDPTAAPDLAGPNQSLVVATGNEPQSLDPQKLADPGLFNVIWEVYESLTTIEKGQVIPQLAEEIPELVDDTTWSVKLKEGVTFSDGRPFNADAVVYSINRISGLDAEAYVTQLGEALSLAGAEKVSEYEVLIRTKSLDPILPNKLAGVKILPVDGGQHLDTPIGTGPYELVSYTAGSDAVLAYNEEWRGDEPQVTDITVKFIPDGGTRAQALQAGEVQLVPNFSPDQATLAPKTVTSAVPTWTAFMRLNYNNPVLADERVRQAVNYAIDKESIVNELFPDGMATVNSCLSGPVTSGDATDNTAAYPYDPVKAAELIEEAGATGATINMVWIAGAFPFDREVGQLVSQQLTEAGLDVQLRLIDLATLIKEISQKQESASDIMGNVIADSLASVVRLASTYYPEEGPNSTTRDPELTELAYAAFRSPPGADRETAFGELAEYACGTAALGYLYDWKDLYGVAANVNYDPPGPAQRPMYSLVTISAEG